MDISLYIHIPFCESKCKYCDFTSFRGNDELIDRYIGALIREIEIYGRQVKEPVRTIFIGGGTPSVIDPRYIYRIMASLDKNFNLSRLEEVSMEANPGTISLEKAKIYKEAKINRISMGAQSFDNEILKSIGRTHSEEDIYRSFDILRGQGFDNVNLDLMFGLPNQGEEDIIKSLNKAISLGVDHISNYSLILEEGTGLYREYLRGDFEVLGEEEDRAAYHKTCEILKANNYDHYEISNFAKPGYQCKHNLVYWNIEPYLGFGISSHSNYRGKRYSNTVNIRKYIEKLTRGELAVDEVEDINKLEEISEYAIMGFRKISGINKEKFKERFEVDFKTYYGDEIKKHLNGGLIAENETNIYLTTRGLDLSNQVEVDFYKIK